MLARSPQFYIPIVSDICLIEFIRKATEGLGRKEKTIQYDYYEIQSFIDEFLSPILDYYRELPIKSVLGRYSIEAIIRENRPIGDVLVELSACNDETAIEITKSEEMHIPLHKFDQNDFHVWITAINENCHYIVTSNDKRFPKYIGKIQRIHPLSFYEMIL